ncbi:MAG TPA: 4-hydroxy-3-methylbut-2-enyl diphosphate reductase [Coriobacteriia bacterium]|nr:4-hydroxy-3-methylbut-2-enyl diphosphate reductase [Coriobacteriia bacterium]
MRVEVARYAGVCYGVERALKLAEEAAASGATVKTLGPLIHNPQAVTALRDKGVEVAACLDEAEDGTLVIRTHGVDPAIIDRAFEKGLNVVDATCPHVSKAHEAAEALRDAGYAIVIVGEADHPEVEGIMAHAGGEALVVGTAEELPERLPSRRIGVVVQTTQSLARLTEIVDALLPRTSDLRVANTICSATGKRQQSAEELAARVDAMVVVGGRNSGNTARLVEVCKSVNPKVQHVETADELDPAWFGGVEVVGVTAGASTPEEQISGVIAAIEAM